MTHLRLLVFVWNETTVVTKGGWRVGFVGGAVAPECAMAVLDVIVSGEKLNRHFADLHKNT